MKRREFLVMTGSAAGAFVLGGCGRQASSADGTALAPEVMPGIESHRITTCLMCPGGCGLRVRLADNTPVGIAGNPNHPINAGGVCTEGMAALQLLDHPDRLLTPMRRREGTRSNPFEPVGWNEVLDEITQKLGLLRDRRTPQKLAFVLGRTGGTMEELVRLFMAGFQSPYLLLDVPQNGDGQVFEVMHGLRAQPAFDFDRADLIFSFGADLLEAWQSPLQFQRSYALNRSAPRGTRGRLVVADTHFSNTAARADEWVGVAPRSQGALALGIAYVMIREALFDEDFVSEHVFGFDDFNDHEGNSHQGFRSLVLREYSPEVASRLTGVPVEKILELGKLFGESPTALAVFDENAVAQPGGLYAGMAVHALNLLKGNLNRPGGIFLQPPVPLAPLATPDRFGPPPTKTLLVEDLVELASLHQPVDALFLYYSNPIYSSPFGRQLRDVLDKIPLVVSFSPFMDETCSHVDIILPDCLPLERWEDRRFPPSFPAPGWGIVQPVASPAGESRHSGEVILDLARRIGSPLDEAMPWTNFEEILKMRARGLHEHQGGTVGVDLFSQGLVKEMSRRGWWFAQTDDFDEFWERLVETGTWTDPNFETRRIEEYSGYPDGKIDVFSRSLQQKLALSAASLADIDHLPHFHGAQEQSGPASYPFLLKPKRLGRLGGGTSTALPWILQGVGSDRNVTWDSWVEVNPSDARRIGLEDHEWVDVESADGRLRVQVAINPGTAPGVVVIPCGLGHSSFGRWASGLGVNPITILVAQRDPLSGVPFRFGTRVNLSKV